MRQLLVIAAVAVAVACAFLPASPAMAGAYCNPTTNCWRDDVADPSGAPTCEDLGGYCRNRVCHCGADPGYCADRCANLPTPCSGTSCGGHTVSVQGSTVHVTDCRGIRSGGNGGVISYCDNTVVTCSPNQGNACQSGANICGMRNSGTIQCSGACSASVPPNSLCGITPVGSHDVADCTSAWGWAFDADYAGAAQVHVYADGVFQAAVTANTSRPDVGAVYPGRTNSGWSWAIPPALKNGLPHSILAYAINVDSGGAQSGANPPLTSSPRSITCNSPPTGALTAATCGTGSGTATDPQGSPVRVSLYDGPSGGGGVLLASGFATPAFTIGFTPFTNGQVHTLYAYAQDIPSLTQYQLTGSQPIACMPTVTLNAAPATVGFASTTTLNWTVSNGVSCTGSPTGWFNAGTVVNGAGSGSASSGPLTGTTTFTLTCTNAVGQSAVATRIVTVNAPPPTASVVNVGDTNYCAGGAGMVIDWRYESVARPIGAYQVQVLQGATVVFDTGKTSKSASLPLPPLVQEEPSSPLSLWTLLRATILDMLRWLFGEPAQACHGDCGPGQNGCAQACDEGGMGGLGYCVDSAPGDGYQTGWGWGKRNGNGNCGGWGNCIVRNCARDFGCNGGYDKVGGGGNDSNGPDGWCRPSAPPCSPNQGNACQSGANICGMRNNGTIQCNGACNAGTPPNSACPTPTCSANPTQVLVGGTVTVTGASGVPAYNWNSGGGTPATGPGTPSRTFTYATTGPKTITITDSTARSATCAVTVCVANWNQPCASGPNACGITTPSTIQCNGACGAPPVTPPPLSACPPPSCSASPPSPNAGQPVTATGASGIPPYTWTSAGLPATGSGPSYVMVFPSTGTKTITVRDSNAKTGTCNVNIGAAYAATGTVTTTPGTVTFSTNYTVRVTVWDADGRVSAPADFPYTTKPGPWPNADFSYSPDTPFAELPVQFFDDSLNGPTGWLWDFGDGQGSAIQDPSHTYATQGTYSVTLSATNAAGTCSVTKDLDANKALPKYREVRPGSQTTETPKPTETSTPTRTPRGGNDRLPPPGGPNSL